MAALSRRAAVDKLQPCCQLRALPQMWGRILHATVVYCWCVMATSCVLLAYGTARAN